MVLLFVLFGSEVEVFMAELEFGVFSLFLITVLEFGVLLITVLEFGVLLMTVLEFGVLLEFLFSLSDFPVEVAPLVSLFPFEDA